ASSLARGPAATPPDVTSTGPRAATGPPRPPASRTRPPPARCAACTPPYTFAAWASPPPARPPSRLFPARPWDHPVSPSSLISGGGTVSVILTQRGFEEALHNYHPDVCIPYWDWTKPEEQHFPDWLVGGVADGAGADADDSRRSLSRTGRRARIDRESDAECDGPDELWPVLWVYKRHPRFSSHLGRRHDV